MIIGSDEIFEIGEIIEVRRYQSEFAPHHVGSANARVLRCATLEEYIAYNKENGFEHSTAVLQSSRFRNGHFYEVAVD